MSEPQKTFFVPEETAVVIGMRHPTLDDEPDADIRSFEDRQDAEQFKRDLESLGRDNQMFPVKEHQYYHFGIERKLINGQPHLAKTSNPFKVRVERIIESAKTIAEAEPTSVEEMKNMIKALQSQVTKLSIAQESFSGDDDALSVAKADEEVIDRDRKDIEQALELDEVPET